MTEQNLVAALQPHRPAPSSNVQRPAPVLGMSMLTGHRLVRGATKAPAAAVESAAVTRSGMGVDRLAGIVHAAVANAKRHQGEAGQTQAELEAVRKRVQLALALYTADELDEDELGQLDDVRQLKSDVEALVTEQYHRNGNRKVSWC